MTSPTTTIVEIQARRAGSAKVLRPVERQLPPPHAGQVQIAVEAAGVAYADIVMRRGLYAGHRPPITPGYDLVGRITSVGAGVEDFRVGQRVAGVTISGSYATHCNVDARVLAIAPEEVDAASLVAATLNGVTAWQMFHRIANPAPGESVLVHGAGGGVGVLLLDIARLAGVRAIGTASSGKRRVIIDRGAEPVDYGTEDVVARARELSEGGVVAAFDHIGGRHFRTVSMPSLRPGGVGLLYGGYDATRDGKVNPLAIADMMFGATYSAFRLFGQSQGVVGYSIPIWRDGRPSAYRADLARVLGLVAEGAIRPLVGATYPLLKAADAHRALEARSVAGKIVLVV